MKIFSNVINVCEIVLKYEFIILKMGFHMSMPSNLPVENIKCHSVVKVMHRFSLLAAKLKLHSIVSDFLSELKR